MWNGGKIGRRLHRELASLLIEFGCKALKHGSLNRTIGFEIVKVDK